MNEINRCPECKKWFYGYLIYGKCAICSGFSSIPYPSFIPQFIKNNMKKIIGIILMIFGIAFFCVFINWGKHYSNVEGLGVGIWFFAAIIFGCGFASFFFINDSE